MREVWSLPGRPDDTYDAMTVTPTLAPAPVNTTFLPYNAESRPNTPKTTMKALPGEDTGSFFVLTTSLSHQEDRGVQEGAAENPGKDSKEKGKHLRGGR